MLRRHAALVTAIALIALVATACIVRTGPRRSAPAYRTAPPPSDHRKHKHKKHSKGRGRDHRFSEAPGPY